MERERRRIRDFVVELLRVSGRDFLDKVQIGKAYCHANIEALREMYRRLCLWPVVKLEHGPAIDDYRMILEEMVSDEWLERVGQHAFRLGGAAPVETSFDDEERSCVAAGWERIKGKSFKQLKDETHRLRSYQEASFFSPMIVELDAFAELWRDPPAPEPEREKKWKEWEARGLGLR